MVTYMALDCVFFSGFPKFEAHQYAQRMARPRSWDSRQEEYIKDEMKNLKREMIRAQEAACHSSMQERKNI